MNLQRILLATASIVLITTSITRAQIPTTAIPTVIVGTNANGRIISYKGVKGTPDPFHFNTARMRELGKRYAIQMLKLQGIKFKEVERPGLLPVPAAEPAVPAAK